MSSRRVEKAHTELLRKLISDSGLVCDRPSAATPESGLSEEMVEEEDYGEDEQTNPEGSATGDEAGQEETKEEEVTFAFPTPSLRRVLPDRVRDIEAQNRIHVLPEEFNFMIDPALIPKIATTAPQKYIQILGELVGCEDYATSLAEFWFLDTMANLLRRAQADDLDRPTQAMLILWFCEWMKEMQHFDAANRQRMMKRFKDIMVTAAGVINEDWHMPRVPSPAEVGIYYKAAEDRPEGYVYLSGEHRSNSKSQASGEKPPECQFQCSLLDLTKILHYIYDLFSTDYQYDLIRSVFTFSPEYVLIDAPCQQQNPKKLYQVVKTKGKSAKSPKKDKAKKGKKSEVELSMEYIGLMALRAYDERMREEEAARDTEAWLRKSQILPLNFAATDEIFERYWPPPPPGSVPVSPKKKK